MVTGRYQVSVTYYFVQKALFLKQVLLKAKTPGVNETLTRIHQTDNRASKTDGSKKLQSQDLRI